LLEVRAPTSTSSLVLQRRILHEYKYRNGTTKYILKKALEKVLPHNILYRSKKGFGVPIGPWFRRGMLDFSPEIGGGALDTKFVRRKYEAHLAGKSDERAFLWNAWQLGQWQGVVT
jgi:asparagine synthase (glutamine-hydrolysing)